LARSEWNPDDFHEELCIFERMRKEIHAIANREIISNENILIEARMESYAKQIYSIMKRFPELNFEGT